MAKAGEKLRVRVLEVDPARKRISLTARLGEALPDAARGGGAARSGEPRRDGGAGRPGGGGKDPGRREPGPRRDGPRETQSGGGDFGHNPFARLLKR
ncbi:MAG: hypothetical protein JNK56_15865 [Myxococcales bacterium]|nr:hypothetical protein [Myxococcales bacterium]